MRTSTTLPFDNKIGQIPEYNDKDKKGNFDKLRDPINEIIIHTIIGSVPSATNTFKNKNNIVSAHYGVGFDGKITQWVDENHTAYHSGKLSVNRRSIGIEHEDFGKVNGLYDDSPRPDLLYMSSAALIKDICTYYNIPIDREHIKKHSEIKSTGCPNGLDIDRLVALARQLANPQPVPQPQVSTEVTQGVQNVLNIAFAGLRTRDGQSFGSVEGMLRELVDSYNRYLKATEPDLNGNPPYIISHELFMKMATKSANLDTLAKSLNIPEDQLGEVGLAEKILAHLSTKSIPEETKKPSIWFQDIEVAINNLKAFFKKEEA